MCTLQLSSEIKNFVLEIVFPTYSMKKEFFRAVFAVICLSFVGLTISCDDLEDEKNCNHCNQDSSWSTVDSNRCYVSESECEQNETGNCVICE